MSDLHVQWQGEGTPLVFLHGWGLHGGVWEETAKALAPDFRVGRIDLPGFGASPAALPEYRIEPIASAVAGKAPDDAIWIGWSLGGTVALAAVLAGAPVRKLVLVAATPRFVQDADWPHAVAPEVLDDFAAELATDYRATVLRFLALQARGSEQAREELRGLREKVFERGEPARFALEGGLKILRHTDLRRDLSLIRVPALVLHGTRDRLVPPEAAEAMAHALPQGRLDLVAGAGHAPFLSHPAEFQRLLKNFIDE